MTSKSVKVVPFGQLKSFDANSAEEGKIFWIFEGYGRRGQLHRKVTEHVTGDKGPGNAVVLEDSPGSEIREGTYVEISPEQLVAFETNEP